MSETKPSAVPACLPLGVTAVMLPELDLGEQLELCRSLGVTHYVLRPRVIPENRRDEDFSNWGNHAYDLTPQRLADEGEGIAEQLKHAGLIPFGTVPAMNLEASDETIDLACRGALRVGAGRVRLSPAAVPGNKLYDWPKVLDQLQGRFRDALAIADAAMRDFPESPPIKFTSEVHSGQPTCTAGLTRQLLEPFDPARVGAIFDLPNLAREGITAPAVSISALGPYIDHCHVGGSRRSPDPADAKGFTGSSTVFTSLRESDLHIPTWLGLIAELAETEGRDIPLICEDYTPDMSGADRLTRTVGEIHECFAG